MSAPWKAACASVQGRAHQKSGIPCQDKCLYKRQGRLTVLCAADGAGSAPLSHEGAQTAVESAADLVLQHFKDITADPKQGAQLVLTEVKKALQARSAELHCALSSLACTLLIAAADGRHFLLWQLGDGICALLRRGVLELALHPYNGEFVNETVFTTSENAAMLLQWRCGQCDGVQGMVLLTDGAAHSLYQKASGRFAPALLKALRLLMLYPCAQVSSVLAQALLPQVAAKTADDCSAALMCTLSPQLIKFQDLSPAELSVLLSGDGDGPGEEHLPAREFKRQLKILQLLDRPRSAVELSALLGLKESAVQARLLRLMERGLVTNAEGGLQRTF
ncbi:MAG: protein phosphatase 2C domain-containing protein [Proteobacteria bacterium]|uniref:Protein phosphatase 2C domain-containing protein n=1 Tax=Candidatus Avisuccinivibrio stercorigallinarum TaxID=2840704 RepID=A0A9D9DDH8_9GAMM|nr:protein phosphatase 2C domain-containing protein [Candidatus Avisuccinivibrio stercorigallinarum]